MVRPVAAVPALATPMISSRVGTANIPSNSFERYGRGCTARSVRSSSSVKSTVNQPVCATPSIVTLRLRSANAGRCATSVVCVMSGSWRATSRPSLVDTRSGSMKSAPISMASR